MQGRGNFCGPEQDRGTLSGTARWQRLRDIIPSLRAPFRLASPPRKAHAEQVAGADPMTDYTLVPDGLTAYGVEVMSAHRFQSVRGFLTAEAARAWIAEQEAADGRMRASIRSVPAKRPSPVQLSIRNRDLLRRAEEARRRTRLLSSRSTVRLRRASVAPVTSTNSAHVPPLPALSPCIGVVFALELQALLGEPESLLQSVKERLGLLPA
jgi:hypothetical protein